MDQLTYVENIYNELSKNCKLRKINFLVESTIRNTFSQFTMFFMSTFFFSVQIQFTIFHVSFSQSILPINQPVDQGVRHAIENFIEYAIIQSNEHQSERRFFIQSIRRFSRILSENEKFEKIFEPQFLKYQFNFRNDVKYQSNFRNDVKYQFDFRDNRYQLNFRDEVRSNRDRNEVGNDKYNFKFQDVRKQQKFYYENIYQQQPSSHSAVESVHQSAHQSMHSFSFRTSVRSHTFQIQSIKRSIPQRPHTTINQPFFTFQNFSFHRATDQPDTLPQISQPRYVSAASFAPTYVSAIDNASVYAFTNAPVYISAYAFGYAPTYAPGYASATDYGFATDYASGSASASAPTRTSRSETTVFD